MPKKNNQGAQSQSLLSRLLDAEHRKGRERGVEARWETTLVGVYIRTKGRGREGGSNILALHPKVKGDLHANAKRQWKRGMGSALKGEWKSIISGPMSPSGMLCVHKECRGKGEYFKRHVTYTSTGN